MCGSSRGPTTATRARTPASIKHMWSATGQRQHGAVVAAVTLSDREQHGRWRAPFVAASTSPSRVGTAARTASTRVCQKGWSHGLAAAVAVLSTPSAPSCLVETHSARGTSEEGTCRGKDAHAGGLDREVPRADKEREGEGQRAPKLHPVGARAIPRTPLVALHAPRPRTEHRRRQHRLGERGRTELHDGRELRVKVSQPNHPATHPASDPTFPCTTCIYSTVV